ncbi:hypothetical protein HQ520_05445 [bacterium]|nr:hypothetical protein [bacterium]
MTCSSLLFAYAGPEFQERLTAALGDRYSLVFAEDAEQARGILTRTRPLALLVAPFAQAAADHDVLRIANQRYPDLPVALVAATNTSSCFHYLRTYGVGAALPPGLGVSGDLLRLFFLHLLDPSALFDLKDYVPPNCARQEERIMAPSQRSGVLERLIADLGPKGHVNVHDLQLVFEEVLNNAIFHAFRTDRNEPKYSGASDAPFDAADVITVEWASGDEYSMLAVTDNQGLLSRHVVWNRFLRQTSMMGLLDTNGRGTYLTHLLSKLVLITVLPGQRTRVAAFFSAGSAKGPKPISIQVVSSVK